MKEYFSSKKALQHIADGKTVKMLSNDFKTHLFSKSPKNYTMPVLHKIEKTIGRPMFMNMSYDEFKEKYKDNEFYIYEIDQ